MHREPQGERRPLETLPVEAPHLPAEVREEGCEEGRHTEVRTSERGAEHAEGDHPGAEAPPPGQGPRHHRRGEGEVRLQDLEEGADGQALSWHQAEEGCREERGKVSRRMSCTRQAYDT